MNEDKLDNLLNHLTEPSTVRGVIWTIGSFISLILLAKGELEHSMKALGITGLVAGSGGWLTSDKLRNNDTENR